MKNFNTLLERELLGAVINLLGNRSINDPEILVSLMTKITGKLGHYIQIPSIPEAYKIIHSNPTEEDKEKFRDFYENLITEYGFEKFGKSLQIYFGEDYYFPSFWGVTKNSSLKSQETLVVGDGVICLVGSRNTTWSPSINTVIYTEDTEKIAKEIWAKYSEMCFEVVKDHEEEVNQLYEVTTVVSDNSGYHSVTTNISPTVSLTAPDFMDNYNKDFPEIKVTQFLEMDRGGIMIFNGHPGCGKSTYLKSLIFKNSDVKFVILPQYLLTGQEAFRNYLLGMCSRSDDYVFIVEDCEQILVQREENSIQFSSIISDILNYTDGIYGDLTRTKFIFTFNTDLKNIDKALLRPGRLFLKYEFCPLIGENLEKLAKKLEYDLTPEEKKSGVPLAELYSKSKTEDLIITKRPNRKIGYMCEAVEFEECDISSGILRTK